MVSNILFNICSHLKAQLDASLQAVCVTNCNLGKILRFQQSVLKCKKVERNSNSIRVVQNKNSVSERGP